MKLTDDQQTIFDLIKREGWTTPLKAGTHLGKRYYEASGRGSYVLMPLVYMGLVKKVRAGKMVRYLLH